MNRTKNRRRDGSHVETKKLPPVQDAVRDYRVIEDGAFAYHLQNEEIENHYSQNVNMRRTVMEDIRKAKQLQDEEDKKARILTIDEEIEAKQLDEELAEFIQEEIYKKNITDEQERKEREARDVELALLMEENERRKVERTKMKEEHDRKLASRMQNMKVSPSPPGSRDEQRMRLMSDEELAKRLQEEESLKVQRTMKSKAHLKSVVEMQDEELAKYIHDREVEAAEMKFKKEFRRKSKKKGKYDDQPLYYDDNVNPPVYHELHPKNHLDEPRLPSPKNQHDRSDPDWQRPPQQRRKPERPPPPKFHASHNTEVKVPLDDSQRQNRQRDNHSQRESSRYHSERAHNGHHSSHDHRRVQSDRDHSRGSLDSLDSGEPHRSLNDKPRNREERGSRSAAQSHSSHGERERRPHRSYHNEEHRHLSSRDRPSENGHRESGRPDNQAPVAKPRNHNHPSLNEPEKDTDEVQYSESLARLTEEEWWNQNNNFAQKGARPKKKNSDCKQQ